MIARADVILDIDHTTIYVKSLAWVYGENTN